MFEQLLCCLAIKGGIGQGSIRGGIGRGSIRGGIGQGSMHKQLTHSFNKVSTMVISRPSHC